MPPDELRVDLGPPANAQGSILASRRVAMKAGLSRSLAGLVWTALLLSVALTYASSKEKPDPAEALRAGIREIVADPARASKMLASVDEIEAAIGELDSLIAEERSLLATLLRDYGSSRAAVDASFVEFDTRRESLARRVLKTHAAFKAEATASEWKKLRKLEMEMVMSAAVKSIGQAAPSGKES
jgi:hypothetical protein